MDLNIFTLLMQREQLQFEYAPFCASFTYLSGMTFKARTGNETPMIFAMAEGPAEACGPGCSAWIVADGSFDTGAENRRLLPLRL